MALQGLVLQQLRRAGEVLAQGHLVVGLVNAFVAQRADEDAAGELVPGLVLLEPDTPVHLAGNQMVEREQSLARAQQTAAGLAKACIGLHALLHARYHGTVSPA